MMNDMEGAEAQTPQVEHSQSEKWYTPLTRVTPLSKALAMGLFILLPFVGFWLGVGYGERGRYAEVHHEQIPKRTLTSTECVAEGGEIVNTLGGLPNEYRSYAVLGNVSGMRCPCICVHKENNVTSAPPSSEWQIGGVCESMFVVEQGLEFNANEHYVDMCYMSTTQKSCEGVDVFDKKLNTFTKNDGIPDCKWVVGDETRLTAPSAILAHNTEVVLLLTGRECDKTYRVERSYDRKMWTVVGTVTFSTYENADPGFRSCEHDFIDSVVAMGTERLFYRYGLLNDDETGIRWSDIGEVIVNMDE